MATKQTSLNEISFILIGLDQNNEVRINRNGISSPLQIQLSIDFKDRSDDDLSLKLKLISSEPNLGDFPEKDQSGSTYSKINDYAVMASTSALLNDTPTNILLFFSTLKNPFTLTISLDSPVIVNGTIRIDNINKIKCDPVNLIFT